MTSFSSSKGKFASASAAGSRASRPCAAVGVIICISTTIITTIISLLVLELLLFLGHLDPTRLSGWGPGWDLQRLSVVHRFATGCRLQLLPV